MTQPRLSQLLLYAATAAVFRAAFPRLSRWMGWPARLGPRGLLAYVAVNTAIGFAIRAWVVPYFEGMAERHERAREELRQQLGREPTDEEVFGAYGFGLKGRRRRPA